MKILLSLVLFASVLHTQQESKKTLWKGLPISVTGLSGVSSVALSPARLQAIQKILTARAENDGWCTYGTDDPPWTENLSFEELPSASRERVLLVQAGAGCGRGAQGANGEMWLFRTSSRTPTLIASPQFKFQGWLYSIQPTQSHGMRDLVLGWHMGAADMDLGYFRFDGRFYRLIGAAELLSDDHGTRLIPAQSNAVNIYAER